MDNKVKEKHDCGHCSYHCQMKKKKKSEDGEAMRIRTCWLCIHPAHYGKERKYEQGTTCKEFDNRYSDGVKSKKVLDWINENAKRRGMRVGYKNVV